jgi:RNA polymerase sigma-70 factor (ECF subfamily)
MPPDLGALLRSARAGDGAALGQILEQFRNYLALLARLQIDRRLRCKVDDSDLVQGVFLEAHRDFAQFRGTTEGELMGWLRQILASNLADEVRRYRGTARRDLGLERELRVRLEQSSLALDGALVAPSSSPSERAIRRERAVLLADTLEKLPGDYREVLTLRHLEELSFPEVARRMGRTLNSVKNVWVRALAQVRDLLDDNP